MRLVLIFLLSGFVAIDSWTFADEQKNAANEPAGTDNPRNHVAFKSLKVTDYTKITGFVKDANLPTVQPTALWKVQTDIINKKGRRVPVGLSNVAVADGVIYFGDDLGNFSAISVADEDQLWNSRIASRLCAKPSVDQDMVYFGSDDGIAGLRREDGAMIWEFRFPHGAGESTPIPVGEHLYASGCDGNAYCLDRKSGRVLWQHNFVDDAPPDKPNGQFNAAKARLNAHIARPNGAACDGELFIQSVFDQSRVIAIDCKIGERRWTFQAKGWISPAPTIAGDRVYVGSQDDCLYCLDRRTGALIWKYDAEKWLASQVAVHEGKVYLPVHGARLHQIDADSGKRIRIMEPSDPADRTGLVYSFPLIAGQTVYFASGSGLLFAFDIQSGEMKWKLRPSESSELFTDLATDGRHIYLTSRPNSKDEGENALFAIGIEN